MEAGELEPDFGPRDAAPDRRRDAGHGARRRWSRSTSSSTRRDARDRAGGRRRAARVRRRPAGRARARAAARRRARAGLDQRPRPDRGAAGRRWSSEVARLAAAPARGRSRPSWSAWRPGARSTAIPEDVPIRGFDPDAPRDRAAARRRRRPLDSGHGPDQEKAPPQAPRHPGRAHRRPRRAAGREPRRGRAEAKAAGRGSKQAPGRAGPGGRHSRRRWRSAIDRGG